MDAKVRQYIEYVDELKSKLKWKLNIFMINVLAMTYVLNDKVLNVEELKDLSKQIQKEVSWFSPFRTHYKYNVSAFLISKYNNPHEKLPQLFTIFKQLRKFKFSNTSYTIISALSLLNEEQLTDRIQKIKDIYKGMQKNHFFLTSYSDYPLATLLSMIKKDTNVIVEEIEDYYQNLCMQGFRKGNDLQFLSNILMILDQGNRDELISKAVLIRNSFIDQKIKIKPCHYSIIGILATQNLTEDDFNQIISSTEKLNQNKNTKHIKNINLIVAAMLFVSNKMNHNKDLIETHLSTTIESIIQAQNAAFVGIIAASSAATASSAAN